MTADRSADQIAIERLYYEYAWAIDAPGGVDAAGVAACFTVDGRWEASPAGIVNVGRDAIGMHMLDLAFTSPMHHYMTNIRSNVAADGLRADTTAYVLFFGQLPPAAGESELRRVTRVHRYTNSCVKVDGEWLFDSLLVSFQYGDLVTP